MEIRGSLCCSSSDQEQQQAKDMFPKSGEADSRATGATKGRRLRQVPRSARGMAFFAAFVWTKCLRTFRSGIQVSGSEQATSKTETLAVRGCDAYLSFIELRLASPRIARRTDDPLPKISNQLAALRRGLNMHVSAGEGDQEIFVSARSHVPALVPQRGLRDRCRPLDWQIGC